MKFINRTNELECLEQEYKKEEASFVVIYGRRRTGKTTLINKFLEGKPNSFYFIAIEENELEQKMNFIRTISKYTNNEVLNVNNISWEDIFIALTNKKEDSKQIIVIDEFQYMGLSNKAFPSILQKIWDTKLKHENIMLILCGSHVSLMYSQTLRYDSPLYGRRTSQIKLRSILFKHYKDFYENKTNNDLIPFYAVTGGIPKYIENFKNYDNIYEAIENLLLNNNSYLFNEVEFLLSKEVSEIGSYFSILKNIANGSHKLSEIATRMNLEQSRITPYLKTLMDLDIIEREVPVTDLSPEKSKKGLYKIKDNFIAFWFKFIYQNINQLEQDNKEYIMYQIKENFNSSFVSFIYEDICRSKMYDLVAQGYWDFTFENVVDFGIPILVN